jgi:hypothetical protein
MQPFHKAMAKGIFLGLTSAQVTAIQAKAVSFLTEGKTTMSYSVDGVSFGKQFPMSVETILDECRYALLYLNGGGATHRVQSSFRC